LMPVLFYYC